MDAVIIYDGGILKYQSPLSFVKKSATGCPVHALNLLVPRAGVLVEERLYLGAPKIWAPNSFWIKSHINFREQIPRFLALKYINKFNISHFLKEMLKEMEYMSKCIKNPSKIQYISFP